MAGFHLVLGNKNYSSWSMRPWVALREAGIPFTEEILWLDTDTARDEKRRRAPSARVPVLEHTRTDGSLFTVWDSLAIVEYVAELFPDAGLWPGDPADRARARSLACEMHAGFLGMRGELPMSCKRRRALGRPLSDEAKRDIERVDEIFRGAAGPFLLGDFSAVDAFYAPPASRFRSYGIELSPEASAYAGRLLAVPAVEEWHRAGAAETAVLAPYDAIP